MNLNIHWITGIDHTVDINKVCILHIDATYHRLWFPLGIIVGEGGADPCQCLIDIDFISVILHKLGSVHNF